MSDSRLERSLAAILATDVAGYSRLMGSNEEATLARLNTLNKAVIVPAIEEFRGRIVKTMGDGLLAEFVSAVDAVRAAVKIQRGTPAEHRRARRHLRLADRARLCPRGGELHLRRSRRSLAQEHRPPRAHLPRAPGWRRARSSARPADPARTGQQHVHGRAVRCERQVRQSRRV
jgi:class 3 adenylate cyclase